MHPISIKGVLLVADKAVLLRNERGEWELPGGRMDPGETHRQTLVREFRERMLPLFDHRIEHAAPLRPVLERTYLMTELADAHRALESNETFGKLVGSWDA